MDDKKEARAAMVTSVGIRLIARFARNLGPFGYAQGKLRPGYMSQRNR